MSLDVFLAALRRHLEAREPHRLHLFDVMAGEARFARAWLDEDLLRLPAGAPVLEVGGGVFLLACQLAREGFAVTSIEPTGTGFGALGELGATVLAFAASAGTAPQVVRSRVEEFTSDVRFPLAFSVHVMEHVESPEMAVPNVSAVLAPGGSYRFICPNYVFPYEPHFNMPTFGSKALTQRLMQRHIEANSSMDDPSGVWRSLNWITVPRVRRIAARDGSLLVSFATSTLVVMLERAVSDPVFARRRPRWMVAALGVLGRTRLLRFAALVPAIIQPIMDVRLTKRI